jgi:hypothetical protein
MRILAAALVAAWGVSCSSAGAAPERAWTPLFNGKDLTGWVSNGTAVWKAEEGILVGGQEGDPRRGGLLSTTGAYKNFELSLDFLIDEHGKYNSGVYLRNDAGTSGQTTYQVNIGRGAVGEYCGGVVIHKGKGIEWLGKGDERDEVRKPLAWNTLRILARGPHIEVDLNGVRVADVTDPAPPPRFLEAGVIGLQTYGAEGHSGFVKFRNVRIREL